MADLIKQPDGTWKFISEDIEAFIVEQERHRYQHQKLPLPQWILDWDKTRGEKNAGN